MFRASSKIPDEFFKRTYAPGILFAGLEFIIEPGDSLYFEVDYGHMDPALPTKVNFSGPAGPDNNYQRATERVGRFRKSFKLPLEEGLKYEGMLMEDRLKTLEGASP